uniref:Integrase, catalytic region, zinc finger, CCHC-type, peptidase aspartic, catalytic n=1 Tax=Tanacetum cinerariifolium TaxID=118510 RepID=A0A6L2J714_TANCI|nr:integrase, catalytic region, zinc finger, CCHC-type, peptidase aspartic, catalytic [Tanacetum cinerariifolium]
MTAPNVTSSTDIQMHNNIMAAGSRDRPSMLAPGRYPQWRSRYLRYVDARPNGEALMKCILSGPYKPTTVLVQAVEATDDSPAVPEHTTVETPMNMSPENKAHFLAEKEAIHLILTGIGDDIYSTVDACQTAQEMWEAIERLQQAPTQLDEVSYHKLFDILKQDQNEVNELRAERSSAPSLKPSIPSRSHTTTRHKGNEIAKPITPPSEIASEEDSDPEQAQRDKDMQKNLALIAKYFKKIYKPTNNNLRTSSNSKNKNVDTTHGSRMTISLDSLGIRGRKPKRVKDSAYHKEKMLLCKQAEQADSGTDSEPVEHVQNDARYNVFANNLKHYEQSEYVSNTCLVETNDTNVIPDSPDMCEDDIQNKQNDVESDDERVVLANLIANLKLDVDENKKIQKKLKKANTTLAQELKECKTILTETSKSLGESISVQDSCLVAVQTKQAEFEKYKAFNDGTVDYDKLERKLNEALGQLAQKDTVIRKGLKTKAYELSVVKEKHDELMKQSLLTKSHYECLVKQKTKVITDLILREEHDIEKMLSMEKQLKFLNKIVYKRSQSIQTIHMMAPKVPTYNGRPTFANLRYLKWAQSKISCLYAFPYDQNTHENRLIPDGEETLALERESRSKLNKDLVRPYDYTTLNSLYEIFKPPTQDKIRQAYNVMTNNINHFKEIVDNAWIKHSKDLFRVPTAQDMEILIQTCLMPLAIKTQNDNFKFVHELKQEMHADLKYVKTLKKEIDELESDKAEFSDMYDEILQECVSKDVMCSYLQSLSDLDALAELQCMYLHKVKECECLAQKLSKQTESVSKKVHTELLQRFAKVEKHSISLEIALQKCKEQVKNDTVCNEKASNDFRKERGQYFKIQDLKAQLQDKNITISELKKLIEKGKGKSVDTKFDKPSVVRQPNAQRIPKPSVLGKPTPFSNSLDRIYIQKTKSVPKANVSEGLSKPVTAQTLPQTAKKAIIQLILFIVDYGCTKHIKGNLKLLCNFVEKFLGTVHFGNDQFAPILGYGDLVQGNVTINQVYYVEGLTHNLFSVGQFCDADLEVGISHETFVARSPQQNGVVKRRNRTLIEAACTMLIYARALLFLWAEAVATACFTQNRSIIRLHHSKTPYELLHEKLPNLSYFHVFGALCYPTNDSENLGKLQLKADIGGSSNMNLHAHMYNIHTVKWSSRNRRISRRRYNLIPAESRFKTPCSIVKDKYMMKAQVHVSKSSAISDVQALPQKGTLSTRLPNNTIMSNKMLKEIVSELSRSLSMRAVTQDRTAA